MRWSVSGLGVIRNQGEYPVSPLDKSASYIFYAAVPGPDCEEVQGILYKIAHMLGFDGVRIQAGLYNDVSGAENLTDAMNTLNLEPPRRGLKQPDDLISRMKDTFRTLMDEAAMTKAAKFLAKYDITAEDYIFIVKFYKNLEESTYGGGSLIEIPKRVLSIYDKLVEAGLWVTVSIIYIQMF